MISANGSKPGASVRPMAIPLLLGLGLLGGCAADVRSGRTTLQVQWDTVWRSSSALMDSVLPSPTLMTYNRGTLFIFDRASASLVALDPKTGVLLWKVGRSGQGPEEFAGISAVFADRAGGVGLVDIRNRRIARVSSLGQFTGLVPIAAIGQQPNEVCALAGNRFVAADVFQSGFLVFDSTGSVIRKLDPVWPDLVEAPSIDSRTVVLWNDEAGKRCLVALLSGRGFALLSPDQSPIVARYIEDFEAYGMGNRKGEGEMEYSAVNDAEFVADTVLILFSGRTPDRGRLVDRYSALSGSYISSYLLPFKTVEFAAGGGMVFGLDQSDTTIVAIRARR